jgi:hypothetical protein
VCARQLEAGDWQSTIHTARANNDLVRLKSQSAFGFYRVGVNKAGGPGLLVDGYPIGIDLLTQRRTRAHFVYDFANSR